MAVRIRNHCRCWCNVFSHRCGCHVLEHWSSGAGCKDLFLIDLVVHGCGKVFRETSLNSSKKKFAGSPSRWLM